MTTHSAPHALPVTGQAIPHFPLIASHFAAGFGWALLGGAGLIAIAAPLARGAFLDPRVLGVTHLFTLGCLTTVITGVLYQIFPAMLGIGERSRRVAWASLGCLGGGTGLLVCGLLLGQRYLQSLGWLALFAAVFGTAWNLLPQRRRAPRNRQLGIYVSYAHMNFGLAMCIAGARIGDAFGWWSTPRLGLIAAHLHLALVGFVVMTTFGLGSRMIPMFYGSPSPIPAWCDRAMPRLLATGVGCYALGVITLLTPVAWAGIVIMAAAGLLFCWLGLSWFRRRARRALDPATAFLTLALASLATAIPLGLFAAVSGLQQPGVLLAYVVALMLGWAVTLMLGVSYRVLPTLTWHHRFAARIGQAGTPTLPMMGHAKLGWTAVAGGSLGIVALVTGLLAANVTTTRAGAMLFTLAIVTTAIHHLRMMLIGRVRPATE
ncbi:MAG: hypothetical protein SGJ01_13260 [Gemmatimonadota bacterium]|nr:hypothetical protein [Gemmatimonadota bacterium]